MQGKAKSKKQPLKADSLRAVGPNQEGATKPRYKRIWASVLSAVPLLALLATIHNRNVTKPTPVIAQIQYVMFTEDALIDVANLEKQSQSLTKMGLRNAEFVNNPLYRELMIAFAPTASSSTVTSAIFLQVINSGKEEADEIIFQPMGQTPSLAHLLSNQSLLLCIQLDRKDGTSTSIKVDQVDMIARHVKYSILAGKIPSPDVMRVKPGISGIKYFNVPDSVRQHSPATTLP